MWDCSFSAIPGSCWVLWEDKAGPVRSTEASLSTGWGGWSCTDDTKAQTVGAQNLATLLLTLSNLMFLPAIAVAVYRYYLVEASVYTYTMFFSTVGTALCPLTPPPELWECCSRLKPLMIEQPILELHKELLGSLDKHLHGHIVESKNAERLEWTLKIT